MSWIPDTIRGVSFNVVAINLTIQDTENHAFDANGIKLTDMSSML